MEKQVTWDNLPNSLKSYAVVVCPAEEYKHHRRRGRHALVSPNEGIADKRQFIIDYHSEEYADTKMIMLDDDLGFYVRKEPDKWNLRPMCSMELVWLFKRMYKLLHKFPIVGLSPRQMNNQHFPATKKVATKQNAVHAINVSVLKRYKINFDYMKLMEDYYVVLSLLTRGLPNCVIVDACWDQKGVSNAEGGVSTYRTPALQAEQATRLAEVFPDYVKLVTKTPKTGWKGMTTRTDVRVSWKKAYEQNKKPRTT